MNITILSLETLDIRFPTSRSLDGSDAMNPDPDYSATYTILKTNNPELEGHGITFTIGRGNEICVAAVKALSYLVVGKTLASITRDMGKFWRTITGDSQLRWLGPEKGVIHLATAAVVNAVWDLYAKAENKPLWKLLADMSPEELVKCIDFRYITDLMTPEKGLAILKLLEKSKHERIDFLMQKGYPAYTTSAGWLGYPEEKVRRLCKEAIAEGWNHIKMKVGADIHEDKKRAKIIREEIGPDRTLMVDANQNWDVQEAIENMKQLLPFNPYWIEEPTNPDDILGHLAIAKAVAPVKVATGEHCQNRVMFKQFMTSGALSICQLDACRLGGVNEVLSVLLMAAELGIPVCPHGGGVGLCEYIQHISMFDFIAVSGTIEHRIIEYVDHLHEHFIDPVVIRNAHYMPPMAPGYSIAIKPESLKDYSYPNGKAWRN